jgi:hypothetical protein
MGEFLVGLAVILLACLVVIGLYTILFVGALFYVGPKSDDEDESTTDAPRSEQG